MDNLPYRVSDMSTVIFLNNYHLNDRKGRKVLGHTAPNTTKQQFDIVHKHADALKDK